MAFSILSAPDSQILRLEGAVTIREAQELAARLREDLEDGVPLEIDTAALEDIDTCILQLLCSLRKSVAAHSFGAPSGILVSAVDRCGLRRELLGAREDS
jgi:anti-anti-sigma regulatory factor